MQENNNITELAGNNIEQHQNINKMEDHEQEYDNKIDISDEYMLIEEESPHDTYVTINNISTAQMNNDPETDKERDNKSVPSNHQYNSRQRPTNRNPSYALVHTNNQLTIPKPHAHITMMQMNITKL